MLNTPLYENILDSAVRAWYNWSVPQEGQMQLFLINSHCEVIDDTDGVHVSQLSIITKKMNTMVFQGVSGADVAAWLMAKYTATPRPMVQDMFPDLNDEEREFLLSGITPKEWQDHFDCEEGATD